MNNNTSKSKAEAKLKAWEQAAKHGETVRDQVLAATGIDIISRMEANQARFGSNPFPSLLVSAENERRLQLQDRKPSFWDRVMSDPNRRDRYDDALLEAHMEAQRQNEGEDE